MFLQYLHISKVCYKKRTNSQHLHQIRVLPSECNKVMPCNLFKLLFINSCKTFILAEENCSLVDCSTELYETIFFTLFLLCPVQDKISIVVWTKLYKIVIKPMNARINASLQSLVGCLWVLWTRVQWLILLTQVIGGYGWLDSGRQTYSTSVFH